MAVHDARTAIAAVIRAQSTAVIIYDGGSAPGTARAIAPIEIRGDKLVARCLETNKWKTFNLDKVRMADEQPIIPRPRLAKEDGPRMAVLMAMDLPMLLNVTKEDAGARSWDLTLIGNSIRAVRGAVVVNIEYVPTISGVYIDPDDHETAVASETPWHVNGKRYVHKNRAFAAFQDALVS